MFDNSKYVFNYDKVRNQIRNHYKMQKKQLGI